MSENDQRRPDPGGAAASAIGKIGTEPSRAVQPPQDLRFRRIVRHLHRLGPRPVGELLLELADDAHGIEGDILARLEKFAETWPPVPLPEVA